MTRGSVSFFADSQNGQDAFFRGWLAGRALVRPSGMISPAADIPPGQTFDPPFYKKQDLS